MGRKYLRLLALLACTSMLTSCALLPEEETVRTAPVLRETQPETYTMFTVQRGDMIHNEKVSARYVPVRKQSLSFGLLGEYVDRVPVSVGDSVEEGQLLGWLRVSDIETKIASAEDSLTEIGLRLAYLQQEYAIALREQEIRSEGLDRAEAAEAMEALEESFAARRENLENQQKIQNLTLEMLKEDLAVRQLRAPFAGTVTYVRDYEEGHLTEYGETAVTIADSTQTVFRAETRNWEAFHEGDRHSIEVKKEIHELEVVSEESLGIEAQQKTPGKKAFVYFRMIDPILGLEDGDYGVIDIELDRREGVLYVPASAVMTAGDKYLVYYQRKDGLKGYKEVKVGVTIGKYTEITAGLAEGEEIIAG